VKFVGCRFNEVQQKRLILALYRTFYTYAAEKNSSDEVLMFPAFLKGDLRLVSGKNLKAVYDECVVLLAILTNIMKSI